MREQNSSKKFKIFFLSWLGYFLLEVIRRTCRFKIETHPDSASWPGKEVFILCFWHNRQLMMSWSYLLRKEAATPQIYTLVSEHSDGRIIASIIDKIGLRTVAGSSSSGGRRALTQMIKILKAGYSCSITPDGPRGPKYKSKDGVILLAKATGAPIYPITYSADRCWIFKSWDNMFIPKPFAKLRFYVGKPFYVKPDINNEEFIKAAKDLEEQMITETSKLDLQVFGRLI